MKAGNTLDRLNRGDRIGQYSIRINDQHRICFPPLGAEEEIELLTQSPRRAQALISRWVGDGDDEVGVSWGKQGSRTLKRTSGKTSVRDLRIGAQIDDCPTATGCCESSALFNRKIS